MEPRTVMVGDTSFGGDDGADPTPYGGSMARDIIDDRLLGALHLRTLTHAGLDHDPVAEHVALQAGTLEALMAGGYEGDATLGELLRIGTQGIGTVQSLDGELIVIDGRAFAIRHDGRVDELAPSTRTPFAVVTRFAPTIEFEVDGPLTLSELRAEIDGRTIDAPIVAIRIDGSVCDLRLRSVARQDPPYRTLSEVVDDQSEWSVPSASGTLVGFRFPDSTAGVEVPGHHLHFLSDDLTIGGHVIDITVIEGRVHLDPERDLHVELPEGMSLGTPGAADRSQIERIEGGR